MKKKMILFLAIAACVAVGAAVMFFNRPYKPTSFTADGDNWSAKVVDGGSLLLELNNDNKRKEWSIVSEPESFASDYHNITEEVSEFHIIALNDGNGEMVLQCVEDDGSTEKYILGLSISRHKKIHLQIDSIYFEKVDTVLETSGNSYTPVQSTGKGGLDEKGADEQDSWSEQDIMSMFSRIKETNWEYADCVLFPDEASGRIGAVLFWDSEKETSNVAFFDADGDCQQCGVYAKLSDEPEFTYLGDGTVTFKLETEDGTGYNYTITISVDGSHVNFKAEDDLLLMRK